MEAIGQRDADAGVVAVHAHAFDFQGLAVEEEAALGVPSEGADAEGGFVLINGLFILDQGRLKLIQIGFVTRPEAGIVNSDILRDLDFIPCGQLYSFGCGKGF